MNPDFSFYDDVGGLERYLNLPEGSLGQIPIYARKPAVDAILKVKEMEEKSLFRPGLYYIVLADLCDNTKFNATYGNKEADKRVQWFHTAAIESIGSIKMENYVTFNKTIGDATLLIFSSFKDVVNWSSKFTDNLDSMSQEYEHSLEDEQDEHQASAFRLRARRLVHLGEVSYVDQNDPLSLAVSQTFKIEKNFSETDLGCTEIVAQTVAPVLKGLGLTLVQNKAIKVYGDEKETMSYYVRTTS